jgi:hypothetical protein
MVFSRLLLYSRMGFFLQTTCLAEKRQLEHRGFEDNRNVAGCGDDFTFPRIGPHEGIIARHQCRPNGRPNGHFNVMTSQEKITLGFEDGN